MFFIIAFGILFARTQFMKQMGWIILICIAGVGTRLHKRYLNKSLKITFFDIGQGDSTLLELPLGKTLLIDAGGGFKDWNAGEKILLNELTRKAILSVDTLLISHPDKDHAYGFLGILKHLDVKKILFNGNTLFNPLLYTLLEKASQKNIHVTPIFKKTTVQINDATLIFFPLEKGKMNNRSLCLYVEYEGCRFFFSGDIEATAEKNLPILTPLTVLKVPHHGSKTSSSTPFLIKTSPKYAVISSGYQNMYGHPHRIPLSRYQTLDTQIFRTDFHGYISFEVKNKKIRCTNFHGSCGEENCY